MIWTYIYPEDSILFGDRWKYKEKPELTEDAINFYKKVAKIAMIVIPIVLAMIIYASYQ